MVGPSYSWRVRELVIMGGKAHTLGIQGYCVTEVQILWEPKAGGHIPSLTPRDAGLEWIS